MDRPIQAFPRKTSLIGKLKKETIAHRCLWSVLSVLAAAGIHRSVQAAK